MINSELGHVKTLEEFNSEIRRQQEKAHGKGYTDIHDAIQKYLSSEDVYMELGTHQGGTASAAMLAKPKSVIMVDIDPSRYYKFLSPIADSFCQANGIGLEMKNTSSIGLGSIANCDMLVIDTVHNADFMNKELAIHAGNVNKYIIAHDTSVLMGRPNDILFQVLNKFAAKNNWKVIERGIVNAGYTVLKRNL
jgi:hypothetical protein